MSNQTELRKKAIAWSKKVRGWDWVRMVRKHGMEGTLWHDEMLEKLYLMEHPETIKEQSNSIVSIEDAAKDYLTKIDNESGTMWTEDDEEIAKHFAIFAKEQYSSLLSSYRELLGGLNFLADNAALNSAEFKHTNGLIEKGNTILSQFNQQ